MRGHRHPNPTVDIRKPHRGEQITLNPPGFVVKPVPDVQHYRIELSRDRAFSAGETIEDRFGPWTVYVPDRPLAPGRWYWRWSAGRQVSQVWSFDVAEHAVAQTLPAADELAERAAAHPRLIFTTERLAALKSTGDDWLEQELARIRKAADACLHEPHEMPEPPWLPDRSVDQEAFLRPWRAALTDSRAFASEMAMLALAWRLWGERRYADAAIARLLSLARWDPDGSTSIPHNDEPHMSVIQHAPFAYDWLFEAMSEHQYDVVRRHLRQRYRNTFGHLRHKLNYGIETIESHADRMTSFLGLGGLALLGEWDEASEWLNYALRVMLAVWPVWGGPDGGWAQGIPYSSYYVARACEFASAVRTAIGFDLYAKSFFARHLRWRILCAPHYAEQLAFGDAADRAPDVSPEHYVCMEHLRRVFSQEEHTPLVQRLCRDVLAKHLSYFSPLTLAAGPRHQPSIGDVKPGAAVFGHIGWATFRRDLDEADEDIALLLKASPYGSISHSHADQNAFVLHAFGQTLAIASGYYDAYGTPHHHCWTRQTKAVNAITLAGQGQRPCDVSAVGRIARFRAGRRHGYVCGRAAAAYRGRLEKADRHVVFADSRYFVIVDDLASPVEDNFWWHLHSYDRMHIDEAARNVVIHRNGVRLLVQFVYPGQMLFRQHNEFDVAPLGRKGVEYPPQWHLIASSASICRRELLAAILIPLKPAEPEPQVAIDRSDDCSVARIDFHPDAWPESFAGRQDVWLFAGAGGGKLSWQATTGEGLFAWVHRDRRVGLWRACT